MSDEDFGAMVADTTSDELMTYISWKYNAKCLNDLNEAQKFELDVISMFEITEANIEESERNE